MMKYGSQRRKPERACRTFAKRRAQAQIAEQLDSLQESEQEVNFEFWMDCLNYDESELVIDYDMRGYDDDDFYLDETQGGRYKEFPREWETSSLEEGRELTKLLLTLPKSRVGNVTLFQDVSASMPTSFPDALDRLNK